MCIVACGRGRQSHVNVCNKTSAAPRRCGSARQVVFRKLRLLRSRRWGGGDGGGGEDEGGGGEGKTSSALIHTHHTLADRTTHARSRTHAHVRIHTCTQHITHMHAARTCRPDTANANLAQVQPEPDPSMTDCANSRARMTKRAGRATRAGLVHDRIASHQPARGAISEPQARSVSLYAAPR